MTTKTQRSYWVGNGRLQAVYNRLWKALVPESGPCETVEGEILRATSKLYYRYYNDGDQVEHGGEGSVSRAHCFLIAHLHGARFQTPLSDLVDCSEEKYEKTLETLVYEIIKWIRAKKGCYTPNTEGLDYLHYREQL